MKLNAISKQEYDKFLQKYLINGQFSFPEEEIKEFDVNPLFPVAQNLRFYRFDSVDTLKLLAQMIYGCYYGLPIAEGPIEDEVISVLLTLPKNSTIDELISLAIDARYQAFIDILEDSMDEEEEFNVLWRY